VQFYDDLFPQPFIGQWYSSVRHVSVLIYETFILQNVFFGPIYLPFQWTPVVLSRGVRLLLRLEMVGGIPALTHTTYDMHINKNVSILPFNGVHFSFSIVINLRC